MYKFLLVDDHALFRRGIKEILEDAFGDVMVGEASSASEMLDLAAGRDWNAIVMDISMPGRSGPEVVRELRQQSSSVAILVLTMHPEDQYAARMFRAGANGYMTKATSPGEFIAAIKAVLSGKQYVSPQAAENLILHLKSSGGKAPHETLSDREFQIFSLLAKGETISSIAGNLSLSATTISTYRARILEKMHMKNNAELTRYAIEHNIIV